MPEVLAGKCAKRRLLADMVHLQNALDMWSRHNFHLYGTDLCRSGASKGPKAAVVVVVVYVGVGGLFA